MALYKYKSLGNRPVQEGTAEESSQKFRLLRVLKGSQTSQVVCQLEVVSLAEPEDYEAVSYSWGQQHETWKWILVDGFYLTISEVSFNILKRRRSDRKDRLVWIESDLH